MSIMKYHVKLKWGEFKKWCEKSASYKILGILFWL